MQVNFGLPCHHKMFNILMLSLFKYEVPKVPKVCHRYKFVVWTGRDF